MKTGSGVKAYFTVVLRLCGALKKPNLEQSQKSSARRGNQCRNKPARPEAEEANGIAMPVICNVSSISGREQ